MNGTHFFPKKRTCTVNKQAAICVLRGVRHGAHHSYMIITYSSPIPGAVSILLQRCAGDAIIVMKPMRLRNPPICTKESSAAGIERQGISRPLQLMSRSCCKEETCCTLLCFLRKNRLRLNNYSKNKGADQRHRAEPVEETMPSPSACTDRSSEP